MAANPANQNMGACGLICDECHIFRATGDPEIAQRIADWFKQERDTKVNPEEVRCSGCKGDRTKHWSPDCWILNCCVDKNGLESCNQCDDFPCGKLNEWAESDEKYGEALNRLKEIEKG